MGRLAIAECGATKVVLDGRELLAFAGCNYLGLGTHPEVLSAVRGGLSRFGLSTSASRETTGNTTTHDDLEHELARFMGLGGAILSAEGYTANFIAMQALARTCRVALIDAHAHRSLRHAAQAAGFEVMDYEHCSPESALWLCKQHADAGVAILTDSVFAADGAVAPLAQLLNILPARRSALVVDDCHGLGVLGRGGRGAVAAAQLSDPRIVVTTTLAKGLGCYGGAVLGTKDFIEQCRHRAWVYRGSTPVPPALAEGVRAAVAILERETTLVDRLRRNIERLRTGFFGLGLALPPEGVPIFTIALSPERRMDAMHERMKGEGLFVPVISYPNGPAERYFRVVVNAEHTLDQIDVLIRSFAQAMDATRDMDWSTTTSTDVASIIEVKPGHLPIGASAR